MAEAHSFRVSSAGASTAPERPDAAAFLPDEGEMAALIRARDWTSTPIGPIESWPASLRTAASICLASRFPMLIWWGPELVMLYNDAYRPMLGSRKHPAALGQPGLECWSEIAEIIGPMLNGVMERGEATWSNDQLLPLERNGYVEECYFTFSYSPICDDTGKVVGVFTAVSETTGRVIGERRLRALRGLADEATGARSVAEASAAVVRSIDRDPADMPFALLYLVDPDGTTARLAGRVGLGEDSPLAPRTLDLASGDDAWLVGPTFRGRRASVVTGFAVEGGGLSDRPPAHSAVVLPVDRPGRPTPDGVLVLGASARRPLDSDYRSFFELVAGHVATAFSSARSHEEERRRAEALAEIDRAKTDFFSNVSHEFRTPLTLLLGPLEEAGRSEGLDERTRRELDMARRNASRLLKLVNSLLAFAQIEAGRSQAHFEPVDLGALTTDLASAFRSAVERAGLRFVVDCPSLPEPVFVDREMWERIVGNLLSNALKFTFEGEIRVRLDLADGEARLVVSDTGNGIAADDLPHVFERFRRGHTPRARSNEGAGIGLALVHELVHLHGGSVAAESRLNEGTAFTVCIPLGTAHLPADRVVESPDHARSRRIEAATSRSGGIAAAYAEDVLGWLPGEVREPVPVMPDAPAARDVATVPAAGPAAGQIPGRTATVLLVDDNADMRDYLAGLLRRHWHVETAPDGETALGLASGNPPDLVLSDVMMPGLDGFELLRALRSDPRTAHVPVILLSARAGEESRVEGLETGANDYLVKPFSARELVARVATHLQLSELRREAHRREQEQVERWRRLSEATLTISSTVDIDETFHLVTDAAREVMSADAAFMTVSVGGIPRTVSSIGPETDGKHAAARAVAADRPAAGRDDGSEASRGEGLAAPLVGGDGRRLGLLRVVERPDAVFGPEDRAALVQFARLASLAVERARVDGERRSRESQQAAVARLGEQALGSLELQPLLDEAAREVAARLGVEYVKVLKLQPDRAYFRLVAGVGWRPGRVGTASVPVHEGSQAGYTLRSEHPVIVHNLATETRFSGPVLLLEHGVVAGVSVAINADGEPWGVLGGHTRTPRRFNTEDVHFLEAVASILGAAVSRVHARERLEQVAHEAQVRAAELRAVLEAMGEGVVVCDREGDVVLANPAAATILGESVPEDLAGILARLDLPAAGETRAPWELAEDQPAHPLEAPLRRTPRQWIELRTYPVLGTEPLAAEGDAIATPAPGRSPSEPEPGERRGTIVLLRDVTEAREARSLREAFIGVLSHELRTPITTIYGGTKLLTRGDGALAEGPRREVVADIEAEAERLYRLVEDLLVLTRFERGTAEIGREPVLLQRILPTVVASEAARRPETRFETLVAPGLPAVSADPTYAEQIVRNLLGNAAKYSPAGSTVTLRADVVADGVEVRVLDEGAGIAPEETDRLFELFYRSEATRRLPGAGIGLFVCRRLIQAMGGRIWATPRPDGGAEFGFLLPTYDPDDTD